MVSAAGLLPDGARQFGCRSVRRTGDEGEGQVRGPFEIEAVRHIAPGRQELSSRVDEPREASDVPLRLEGEPGRVQGELLPEQRSPTWTPPTPPTDLPPPHPQLPHQPQDLPRSRRPPPPGHRPPPTRRHRQTPGLRDRHERQSPHRLPGRTPRSRPAPRPLTRLRLRRRPRRRPPPEARRRVRRERPRPAPAHRPRPGLGRTAERLRTWHPRQTDLVRARRSPCR